MEDEIQDPIDDGGDAGEVADPGTPPEDGQDPAAAPPAEGGEEPPQPGTQAWADLEKKYPGLDEDQLKAMVGSRYWDQTKELSRLTREHRALELEHARLRGRFEQATPAKKDEPEEVPAEVAELDQRIHSLKERDGVVFEQQVQTLKDLSVAQEKVGEIKGLLAAAKAAGDDEKIARFEGRQEIAEQRVEGLRDKLDRQNRERNELRFQVGKSQQERDWTAKVAREAKARQEDEERDLQEQYEEAPKIINALITEAINLAGLPADPALRQDLRETLQDKITIDLWSAGKKGLDFRKVNIPGLLKQHTDRYIKARGVARREGFRKESEERQRTADPPRAPKGGSSAPAGGKPAPLAGRPAAKVIGSHGELSAGMLRGRRLLEKTGW